MPRSPLWLGLIGGAVLIVLPGRIHAGHENFSCGECHIVHMSAEQDSSGDSRGAWNSLRTEDSLPTFTLYSSPSFDALGTDIAQPEGTSKLCLGCHDGSFATGAAFTTRRRAFGTSSLSRSHPVSFTYDSALAARVRNGALRDPEGTPSGLGGTIATDLLDDNGKLQCTSCHDVHASGRSPKLLRYPYGSSAPSGAGLCRVCHNR